VIDTLHKEKEKLAEKYPVVSCIFWQDSNQLGPLMILKAYK